MGITREQLEQIIREEINNSNPPRWRLRAKKEHPHPKYNTMSIQAREKCFEQLANEFKDAGLLDLPPGSPLESALLKKHMDCINAMRIKGDFAEKARKAAESIRNTWRLSGDRPSPYLHQRRQDRPRPIWTRYNESTQQESKMNITKEELARIIKEETSAVLESWKDYPPNPEYDAKIKARVQAYNKQFEEVTKTINDLEKESPAAAIKTAGDLLKTGVGGNHELIDWLKTKVEDLRDDWQTRHFSEEKIYQEGILDRLKGALGSEPVGHGGWTKGERKAVTALLLKAFEKYSADDSPQRSADLAKAVGNALHSLHTRDLLDPLKLQDVLNAIAKKDNVLKTSGEENAAAVSDRIRAGAFPAP